MSRKLAKRGSWLLWVLVACDSGALESHRVQVPAKLAFTVQPTAVIAGAAIRPAVVVTVQDAHGSTVTGASTQVRVALGNNPARRTLLGTVTLDTVNGVAVFPDLSLDTAGNGYTLIADATGLSGATSSPFNVSLAPTSLAFVAQPSSAQAGNTISPAVQVAVLDDERNMVESANMSVTVGIGSNPSGGTLEGPATAVVVNGVATFRSLIIDNPGTGYTLTAKASGLNGASSAPFNVSGGFVTVNAGWSWTSGLTAAGVACWWGSFLFGNDPMDDLAYATSKRPVALAGGLTFATVSAGYSHSCGRTISGAAYCWGGNNFGQLGSGSERGSRTPVAVAGGLTFAALNAGGDHSCGVTTAGAAHCWGGNFKGELGNGSTANSTTPVAVAGGLTFAMVTGGRYHSCGVTTSLAAYCWGANDTGQLGNGSTTDATTPVAVSGGLTFEAVSAGGTHTCGVTPAGTAYCWGGNDSGQLGDGSMRDSSRPVRVAGELTFATVSAGDGYSCAVTTSGAAYCWGHNEAGQLGNGSTTTSSTPVAVAGGFTFATVSAGPATHTCGVSKVGVAYCWGRNDAGQLGIGSTTDSLTPMRVPML